jgi:arginyl-tRNA synthetase
VCGALFSVFKLTPARRYLQYAHVRLCSIVRKSAEVVSLPLPAERTSIQTHLLTEPKARDVLALLAAYPDTVKLAFDKSEPTTIVSWCFRISHAISSAYEVLLVRDQEAEVAQARLYLYVCARDVLGSALRLLTLTPLDRM